MRRLPLTPLQTSLVLASVRSPESGSYILQDILELPEKVNAAALKEAWNRVAARHTILRTSIEGAGEGVLWQHVHESPETHWRELDWFDVSAEEQERNLTAVLEQDWKQGFDFEAGPPLRFLLIRHTVTFLQAGLDLSPRSARRTIRAERLARIVHDLRSPPRGQRTRTLPGSALSGLRRLDPAAGLGTRRAFLARGADGPVSDRPVSFRNNCDRPAAFRPRARNLPFLQSGTSLSQDLTHRLTSVARNCGGTLNMVVLGAWALLLNRYSGANEVVFGVTHTARPRPVGARIVGGRLISTRFPCACTSIPKLPLTQWLRQLAQQWRGVRAHRWAPAERFREWSGLARGKLPFDSVVVYDTNTPQDWLRSGGGAWTRRVLRRKQRTDVPLTLGSLRRAGADPSDRL